MNLPTSSSQSATRTEPPAQMSPAPARSGTFKDFRADLPQVVILMAVIRDGVPVWCWTFSGNTGDQPIMRTITDDLGGWNLRRLVWVADRGFASAAKARVRDPRGRALHPRREAASHQQGGRRRAGPAR